MDSETDPCHKHLENHYPSLGLHKRTMEKPANFSNIKIYKFCNNKLQH